MMSFDPVVVGRDHNVYFPAGTSVLPNIKSADVMNCVAALAPVRQTVSSRTLFPKIFLPLFIGRLETLSMSAAPIVARTVSAGDVAPAGPCAVSYAAQLFAIP